MLRYFNAPESEYACIFTPNATGALRLVGEAYPFAPGAASWRPFDNHNSVNGIREFARAKGRRDGVRAARGARPARRRRGCWSATSTTPARRPQPLRLSRRSRTSPASSTRWSGSTLAQERAGTCSLDCAAFVPTSRLDLSVVASRTSSRSPSTRCSATRPASARCSRGAGRSSACSGRGSAAAPSSRRTSRATWSCRTSGHARFEDGTVNYLGDPGGRDRPAPPRADRHRHDRASASQALGSLAARGAAAAAPLRRQPGGPHLRAGDVGPPRGHDRVQLPAPGRPRRRRALRRPRRGRARHLRPDRLLLQPGRRRGRVLDLEGAADRREFDEGMILDDYIRRVGMPTGGAVRVSLGLATQLRRRLPLHATSRRSSATSPRCPRTCRRGSPARRSPRGGRAGAAPAQRRHQVAVDHVEEHVRAGVLAVEEPLERLPRQHEQERPLARRRGRPATARRRSGPRSRTPARARPARRGCAGRRGRSPSRPRR